MSYQIEYADAAIEHLKFLTTRQQRTVLDTVDEQLKYEPLVETRNRKPMEPNSLATWELRIGNLRVYYDVEENTVAVVYIQAVGVKNRNRVRIGQEEIEL
ncbi:MULTISPECIES: type II toxin-antitoxin system RelE/ParE family toxin [unclassified Microcoleus]|uniref:type II toxin-antitoxin system RelE/ParE family toxin n=1 Tax=unclassified Microcoleus TaxID=2642155 RepID=UPI002FD648CB